MARTVLLVGTRKGLFLFESDEGRANWALRGPFCEGWPVYHAVHDAGTGAITSWMYRDESPSQPMLSPEAVAAGFPRTGREIPLRAPMSEEDVRALKVGDVVLVSGRVYTGRDAVHAHLMKHEPPVDLHGAVLYHCGPVVAKEGDGWRITAAGPTTSIREEPYQAEILERYGVRVVIGKGGMGAKTLAGLKESGAVYLNGIGGAAQIDGRDLARARYDVVVNGLRLRQASGQLRPEDVDAINTLLER